MSIANPTDEHVYLQFNVVVATISDIDVNELYPLNDETETEGSHSAYCSNINIPSNISLDRGAERNSYKPLRLESRSVFSGFANLE